VGTRKANEMLAAGARVRLVCLEPRTEGLSSTSSLEWIEEAYSSKHLQGAQLVFAAATPEVDRCVAADARARGLWVNVASDAANCDFHVPATLRRGNFVVAVGTGGASPLLAHRIRMSLANQFDQAFGDWVELLAEFRPLIQEQVAGAPVRHQLLEELCETGWLDRLRSEGIDATRAAMRELIARYTQESSDRL